MSSVDPQIGGYRRLTAGSELRKDFEVSRRSDIICSRPRSGNGISISSPNSGLGIFRADRGKLDESFPEVPGSKLSASSRITPASETRYRRCSPARVQARSLRSEVKLLSELVLPVTHEFPSRARRTRCFPACMVEKSLELGCPCQATAWPHRMIAAVEALELSKTSGAASLGRQRRKRWPPQCVTSSYECCDDMSQFGKFDVPRS